MSDVERMAPRRDLPQLPVLRSSSTAETAFFARASLSQTGHELRRQQVTPVSPPSRMPWRTFVDYLQEQETAMKRQVKRRAAEGSAKKKATGKGARGKARVPPPENAAQQNAGVTDGKHDGGFGGFGGERSDADATTRGGGCYCLPALEIGARGVRTDGRGSEMIGREGLEELVQRTEAALVGPAMAPLLSQLGVLQSETIDVRPLSTPLATPPFNQIAGGRDGCGRDPLLSHLHPQLPELFRAQLRQE